MAVEFKPFIPGKKKIIAGLLTPFIATAITAIFIRLGIEPLEAAELAIKISLATAGGYMGLEFLKDILRDRRTGGK